MIDLVKALRSRATWETATGITEPHEHIDWMAADEITRLREELTSAKRAAEAYEAWKFPEDIQALTVANERLLEENARLREALKPFAIPADTFKHFVPDSSIVEEEFTLGQLRKARAAIREEPTKGEPSEQP